MINIRERTADYVHRYFDLDAAVTEALFETGLLREDIAKKVLIRDDYLQHCSHRKKTDLKIHLSEKYAVSLSTIEKVVCENHQLFP